MSPLLPLVVKLSSPAGFDICDKHKAIVPIGLPDIEQRMPQFPVLKISLSLNLQAKVFEPY
jgi:hypothetical protein